MNKKDEGINVIYGDGTRFTIPVTLSDRVDTLEEATKAFGEVLKYQARINIVFGLALLVMSIVLYYS